MGPDNPEASTGVAIDLTHLALSVARFFASMELAHDAGPLTRLGAGRLRLDLRRRLAQHGERWISFPGMGDTLRHRIGTVLGGIELSVDQLHRAELEADVKLAIVPRPELPGMGNGWAGDDGPLVRYDVAITVRLAAPGGSWQAQHKGNVTWPESWGRRP